ncbi:MAG TPA: hypothetical protein VMS38_05820, partial [Pseudorhodoferax sp.]|nr:hypothetical protein [Pseudorhodoferax sp.]
MPKSSTARHTPRSRSWRISDGTLPNNAARQVFEALWTGEQAGAANALARVDAIIEAKDLKPM